MTSILFIFVCAAICLFILKFALSMIFSIFDLSLAAVNHAIIMWDMHSHDKSEGVSRQHSRSIYRR